MALEWLSGLFQSDNQQTRGLSGDRAHSVALDDANPYYNYRLKRHKAEGDLVGDPGLLWYTSPYVKRRSGLGTHVAAEVGDGTANYTDVLLVLSREDFAKTAAEWQASAARTLQQEFDNFCRRENFNKPYPHRPLGVRLVEDGSAGTGGYDFQLGRGEFITGLLTNLYTGPVRGSYPVIGIHLNLPEVWEGYQEVGRLYNDQILFTLGNHWLDSFSHASLQQAALYRLRQYPDGTFVHIVNPDLQDQYHVTSTVQGNASVLTLATRSGKPLAYMVLAVIDPPAKSPTPPERRSPSSGPSTPAPPPRVDARSTSDAPSRRPDIQMPKPPPKRDAVPSIAPPMMLEDVVKPTSTNGIGLGGKTIIPDAPSERIFTLQERGALLQKVHFSAFMLGYDVYFGTRGELGTHVEDPAATFQVRKRAVSLVAHIDGVTIDGRSIAAGVEVPIEGDVKIEVAGHKLEYHDLRGLQLDGWPYVGEIRRPASSTYMIWGEDYQVGRSRECRVVLPDEPRNDNIHWKPSVGDGATIRARTGEIPKSRFYTDSIMVGSEHVSVDLRGERPKVVCTNKHCYAYVRRSSEVFSLYPTTSPQQPKELDVLPGDEILIGNCLFHVGYTAGDAVAPAPAPMIDLTVDHLAGSVQGPDIGSLDRNTVPPLHPREITPPLLAREEWKPAEPPTPPPAQPRSAPEPSSMTYALDDAGDDELSTAHTAGPNPTRNAAPAPVDLDGPVADVGGWDHEDWEDSLSVPGVPDPSGRTPEPMPRTLFSPPLDQRLSADIEPDDPIVEPPSTPNDAASSTAPTEVPSAGGAVATVDDAEAQFEIARPMHLVLAGWAVNGEVVCGNHADADLVLPENRIRPGQSFAARNYFRLRVRGRKGSLEVLAPDEMTIDEQRRTGTVDDPEAHRIEVIRRDDAGEPDFVLALRLQEDTALPGPRVRYLAVDTDDRLAAALVTRGLPKGAPRTLEIGGLKMTLAFDGSAIRISDYLASYRRGDGFHPFMVQRAGGRFITAPEDGSTFELAPGDRMVIGICVYVLRKE
ncbi:MAG: hypothetical protein ABMA64_12330 [Myxococcota bacterium]